MGPQDTGLKVRDLTSTGDDENASIDAHIMILAHHSHREGKTMRIIEVRVAPTKPGGVG